MAILHLKRRSIMTNITLKDRFHIVSKLIKNHTFPHPLSSCLYNIHIIFIVVFYYNMCVGVKRNPKESRDKRNSLYYLRIGIQGYPYIVDDNRNS